MATIIDDDCNIPQKKCETSNNYNKDDIVEIADKCGIDIYNEKGKLKTRKQLCKEIAEKQQENNQPFAPEIPLPTLTIPETEPLPLSLSIPEPVIQVPLYTEDILKKNTKAKLLEIAEELGIKKWKNKGIKGYNKPDIIEAILTAIAVEEPLPVPLPEPTIIIVEDEPPTDIPLEVIEKPTKKDLNKKTKKQLLENAEEYGIKKWKNKAIKGYNKPDIIEAILDYFETNVAPTVVPTPPIRIPSPVPSRIPSPITSPKNIQELIKQKRQELLRVLKFKEQEQCNPLEGKYCSDDKVCDINKKPNICISKEEATYRENKGFANIFNIGDKKLIGNEKQIDDLFKSFGGAEETKEPVEFVIEEEIPISKIPISKKVMCNVCTYVNDPDTIECIICNSDLTEEEINNVILPEDTIIVEREEIPEGTRITELENIEDILNEIQKTEDTKINLEGLDEAKKKVLYCLGLLN
jgi:hypothetical protein